MKKILLLICFVLCFSLLTGCSFKFKIGNDAYMNNDNDKKDIQNDMNNDDDDFNFEEDDDLNFEEDEDSDNTTNIKDNPNSFADNARFSTANDPIKMGDAGIIIESSYNNGEFKGEQVYLRIKEKLSKSEAARIVEEYNKDSIVTYSLGEGIEWNGVIVEVDLKDYPITSKYGNSATLMEPSLSIASKDDGLIKWNGKMMFSMGNLVTAVDEEQKPFQGDVFECYFIYGLLEGFDDEYLIKAYNYKSEEHPYTYFLMK